MSKKDAINSIQKSKGISASLIKHICYVADVSQRFKPTLDAPNIRVPAFLPHHLSLDFDNRLLRRFCNCLGPADKDPRALSPQSNKILSVLPDPLLHIPASLATVWCATECSPHIHGTATLPFIHLLMIEILFGRSTAKEEDCRREGAACSEHHRTLLEKASEWSDTRTGRDADDWSLFLIKGQAESSWGRLDGDVNGITLAQGGEVRGGDAVEAAMTGV